MTKSTFSTKTDISQANFFPRQSSGMGTRTFYCRKTAIAFCLFLFFIGFSKQALASGDYGCATKWKLVHHEYEGCNNMAGLTPANDTRVNLLLLMADLHPTGKAAPN